MGQPGATGANRAGTIDAVQWPSSRESFRSTATGVELISYSFDTGRPSDLNGWTDVSGFGSYSTAERAAIRAGLDQFEDVLNVRFVEQSAENTIDFSFLKSSEGVSGGRGRFQWFSSPYEYDGFILFNTNRDMAQPSNTSLMLHEIAHALSLKHPGNYDVNPLNAPPGPYLPEDEDNNRFTLMSYTPNPETGEEADSLMLYDIAGLQERWGANLTARTGNTTYTAPAAGDLEAIWDAGGYDTISAAGSSADMVIDLRQAHFSGFGGIDRLVVGYDVVIEAGEGGTGRDTLHGNAVGNRLMGGGGNDTLVGRDGADLLAGGPGADRMDGGRGNDTFIVDNAGDVVIETLAFSQGGGIDTVRTFINYVQPDNIELVRLGTLSGVSNLNAVGNDAPGTLVGNAGNNSLTGRGGDDQINGNGGNDWMIGNTGRDTLVGGAGEDTFVYTSISESRAGAGNRDLINGFDRGGDLIDLAAIDANLGRLGEGAFTFIGNAQFSGTAGELRLQGLGGPNAVLVEGDVRGDGVADFQIFVNLTRTLSADDFSL